MQLDLHEIFSDGQAITSGSAVSANVFKFGKGDALVNPVFVVRVADDFAGGAGVSFILETSEDAAFTAPVTLLETPVKTAALKAGNNAVEARVPFGNLGYLRVKYVADGTFTAGKVDAYLAPQVDLAN